MNARIISVLLLLLGFTSISLAQTPDIYWGLNWSMSTTQVDSTLESVFKDKKSATKTNYVDNRQLSGFSYRIAEMGIAKIYIWFNVKGDEKISIHSIEVLYSFDYPYDAQRFKQAYFEKYGHVFEESAEAYQVADGTSVLLRLVKEPAPGVLGQTVYQVSMLSPIPFEMSEKNIDFLF
ncbi:MAG: hypothetical protein L3J79_07305 [Candidatus Marinimicrobia bacterium]|nr:hypothetical protein [Candidatus Neomarinimicrobiota bacterium]